MCLCCFVVGIFWDPLKNTNIGTLFQECPNRFSEINKKDYLKA